MSDEKNTPQGGVPGGVEGDVPADTPENTPDDAPEDIPGTTAPGEGASEEEATPSPGETAPDSTEAPDTVAESGDPAPPSGNSDAAPPALPPDGPPAVADEPEEPEGEEAEESRHGAMGFFDHLTELRVRLMRCVIAAFIGFLLCYSVAEDLFGLLMAPLVRVFPPDTHLIFTSLPEAFFTYMTVAAVAGVFVASPYIFYQVWCFVAPGLYDEERKALVPIAFFSAFFFVGGAMFGYHVVFPHAFEFFMSYTTELIRPMPALKEYLNFSLKMLFAFGLIFEMPLFVYFLARLGLVTADFMRRNRKYAILLIFIVAAVLTPPDVISQSFMALPMLVLYELSVYVAKIFGRKKQAPEEEATEKDEREDLAEDATDKGDGAEEANPS